MTEPKNITNDDAEMYDFFSSENAISALRDLQTYGDNISQVIDEVHDTIDTSIELALNFLEFLT